MADYTIVLLDVVGIASLVSAFVALLLLLYSNYINVMSRKVGYQVYINNDFIFKLRLLADLYIVTKNDFTFITENAVKEIYDSRIVKFAFRKALDRKVKIIAIVGEEYFNRATLEKKPNKSFQEFTQQYGHNFTLTKPTNPSFFNDVNNILQGPFNRFFPNKHFDNAHFRIYDNSLSIHYHDENKKHRRCLKFRHWPEEANKFRDFLKHYSFSSLNHSE